MIPLKDDNPRVLRPVVNYALILTNIAIYVYQYKAMSPESVQDLHNTFGVIPAAIMKGNGWYSFLTSLFLHDNHNLKHLIGNMLYLWIFGDNVEGLMGHKRYLFFYLLCGVVAVISHILIEPNSMVPLIGASGAISGVLGAYVVNFPRARIWMFIPPIFFFRVPALLMLGMWFLGQLAVGLFTLSQGSGNIAWFAHIGGFIAGLVLIKFFERRQYFVETFYGQ
ncbi:MAG: hypothetical protein ALAOOOJD_04003 [bacterium]|nr:hypothetical protein [bacterium]